jgi:hypothetical protein
LEEGHLVIDLQHTNLEDERLGWYSSHSDVVPVPAEHVLVTGLDMAAAEAPRGGGRRNDVLCALAKKGCFVLSASDRERTLAELRMRRGGGE